MVPFASLAILQREGQLDYALSSGRTRSGSSDDKEYNFIQSSTAYGATSNITFILVSSRRKINTPTCC
nr:Outer membrane usher protein fimD precursor [Klebsiella pneumoniae]